MKKKCLLCSGAVIAQALLRSVGAGCHGNLRFWQISQPGDAGYAQYVTTGTTGFSNLPTVLTSIV